MTEKGYQISRKVVWVGFTIFMICALVLLIGTIILIHRQTTYPWVPYVFYGTYASGMVALAMSPTIIGLTTQHRSI